MDNMILEVEIKNVYGIERIYPVGPESLVDAVQGLTGRKTIDRNDIRNLYVLGIKIQVLTPAL